MKKYLLSLSQVAHVKQIIRPFVQEDKNSINGPYTVLSLYLDGIDRPFIRQTKISFQKDSSYGFVLTGQNLYF